MINKCETCKYFQPDYPDRGVHGECRKLPPVVDEGNTCFPMATIHWRCGEWAARRAKVRRDE